jgi:cytochrome P450
MIALIDDVKNKHARGEKVASENVLTIFDDILDSKLPGHELATERLWKEAQVIVIAGTETTAWTLSVITYYLLENPAIMQRLRKILEEAIPDPSVPLGIRELEQIPFLVRWITDPSHRSQLN